MNIGGITGLKKLNFFWLLSVLVISFSFFATSNHAAASTDQNIDGFLTDEEVESLNEELQVLVEQANEQLAKGENEVNLSSENLELVFSEAPSTNGFGIQSVGSTSYQAYVSNTKGFNFTHAVSGKFSYNKDKLTAVSYKADLTGKMYDRSSTTWVTGMDGTVGSGAKIARVTSQGSFKAAKYFKGYYTTLMVDVFAPTKSYKIVEAKITS